MVPSTTCPSLCYKVTDDTFSSIVKDQIICQSVLEICHCGRKACSSTSPHYGNCHYGTSQGGIISLCIILHQPLLSSKLLLCTNSILSQLQCIIPPGESTEFIKCDVEVNPGPDAAEEFLFSDSLFKNLIK